MYHIKNDRRARNSAELICEGLMRCMNEKSCSQIKISDIQRASTVSRSTFYRNFDCLEDVLMLICDRAFEEIYKNRPPAESVPEAVFCYWYEHGELLETLVNSGKTEVFLESFRRSLDYTTAVELMDRDSAEFQYFSSGIAYIMIGTLITWIRRGRIESKEELFCCLRRALEAAESLELLRQRQA